MTMLNLTLNCEDIKSGENEKPVRSSNLFSFPRQPPYRNLSHSPDVALKKYLFRDYRKLRMIMLMKILNVIFTVNNLQEVARKEVTEDARKN